VDLLLTIPGGELWVIEVKPTMAPKIERGFHSACTDLNPQKRFYVYPGVERFPLDGKMDAISVVELAKTLQSVQLGSGHKTKQECSRHDAQILALRAPEEWKKERGHE
jgi:hypothetical protein